MTQAADKFLGSKNAPISLARRVNQVPVTSVTFYTSQSGEVYLLAGENGHLTVYATDEASPTCKSHVAVFDDQPIHGICAQHRQILVWGAEKIALFDGEILLEQPQPLATASAPDWIYDVAVSPWDSAVIVLATAHNEVVPVTYEGGRLLIGEAVSPSRPMLFTSQLVWLSADCVLVAGGTVFGDVLVWKYYNRGTNPLTDAHELLYVLRGHEGSIYGVDLSPELILEPGGTTKRLLASCSDDRTIRIWDISESTRPHASVASAGRVQETGFKAAASYNELPASADGEVVPVAVAMGHVSRIWGVKFVAGEKPDRQLSIYSFGEDATCQRWRLTLSGTPPYGQLVNEQMYNLHSGKHLWARAVWARKDSQRVTIATGGADGQITLIEDVRDKARPRTAVFEVGSVSATVAPREIISRYDFLDVEHVLAITSEGRVFVGTPNPSSWREVIIDNAIMTDLKQCYVLRRVGGQAAVLGTSTGNVYLFHAHDQIIPVADLSGRIVEINCLDDSSLAVLLVHLHGSSTAHYLVLDTAAGILAQHEEVVGLDERFVAVSAALVDGMLAIGSRHGYLSLLSRSGSNRWTQLVSTSTRSKDAITAIIPLPCTGSASYILATSRDGRYRIYEIQSGSQVDAPSLVLLHDTSPPFGPMIEGAWFTDDLEPELILYGFRSKYFIIWNESRREELAAVDCGGAHRTFRAHKDGERYRFGFTRTSKLSIWSQDGVSHRVVKAGTHGREVRALSFSGLYLASGAEDTSIRIWRPSDMRCLASMKTHVTGIQKLRWFGDYLFSSGGNEEFFVARVRTLGSSYRGLAVMTEAVFTDKSPIGDLRIMDFDVSGSGDGLLVTLAFSNSTIKRYKYSEQTFTLLCEGTYTGSCITQLQHVSENWIITGSTDGHLALWMAEGSSLKFQSAVALHQSSIKAMDMVRNGDQYDITTGGDDNSLGFATVTQDRQSWQFSCRARVRSAHAAAVNGVAWLGDLAVSVSNDQRLKAWRLDRKAQRIALVIDVASGVADPGDVAVVNGDLVLGGVGVEKWALNRQ